MLAAAGRTTRTSFILTWGPLLASSLACCSADCFLSSRVLFLVQPTILRRTMTLGGAADGTTALGRRRSARFVKAATVAVQAAPLSTGAANGSGDDDGMAGKTKKGRKQKKPPKEVEVDENQENVAVVANIEEETAPRPPRKKRATAGKKVDAKPVVEEVTKGSRGGLAPDKEMRLHDQGYHYVYGIDEAGRGPLAGPVVAAACYVAPDLVIPGIQDSKVMDEEQREEVFEVLMKTPGVLYSVSIVDHKRIDEINILQATLQGMRESLDQCLAKHHKPKDKIYALVDGNRDPGLSVGAELMIKGDSRVRCIAAASILAKVTRDRLMVEYDKQYPVYGFAQHKGYPTPSHKAAIAQHGPCPIHRMTFKPIRKD